MPLRLRLALAASVALGLAALALPGAARAQTLFADNFNSYPTEVPATPAGSPDFFDVWAVTDGSVDIIGSSPEQFDFYPGNGNYLDLDGGTFNAATLSTLTSFALTPGDYVLSFSLGKNGGDEESMTVSLGGAYNEVFANGGIIDGDPNTSGNQFQSIFRPFTVSGATVNAPLVFNHAGGNNAGFILDNVSLVRVSATAVPETGTLALLALPALAGVFAARRRAR